MAIDADPAKAQAAVGSRMKDLLAQLSSHRIADSDIQAFEIEKEAISNENTEKGRLAVRGYKVSRLVSFKVRDLRVWADIADALLNAGNIEGVSASFDRTDRASIVADLDVKAAKDAVERGGRMAQSFGRKLGAAVAISQSAFASIQDEFGIGGESWDFRAPPAVVAAPPPSPEQLLVPATISISSGVNAIFKLE